MSVYNSSKTTNFARVETIFERRRNVHGRRRRRRPVFDGRTSPVRVLRPPTCAGRRRSVRPACRRCDGGTRPSPIRPERDNAYAAIARARFELFVHFARRKNTVPTVSAAAVSETRARVEATPLRATRRPPSATFPRSRTTTGYFLSNSFCAFIPSSIL